eukprot:GHRR01015150.1.p1 GENE.GHRR01015150.1~~GHRR01015150.1.p1  ORF type:complete len:122 (-),score=29.34 GHRR01015150.1:316-681(-)
MPGVLRMTVQTLQCNWQDDSMMPLRRSSYKQMLLDSRLAQQGMYHYSKPALQIPKALLKRLYKQYQVPDGHSASYSVKKEEKFGWTGNHCNDRKHDYLLPKAHLHALTHDAACFGVQDLCW